MITNVLIAADLRLGRHLPRIKDTLQSLKVVEYLGPSVEETSFSSRKVRIEVQVYEIYDNPMLNDTDDFPQAEVTSMPHVRFDGIWDEYGTYMFPQLIGIHSLLMTGLYFQKI